MGCTLEQIVLGSVNLRIRLLFAEKDSTGAVVPIDLAPAATPPGYVQLWVKKPSRIVLMKPCVVDTPTAQGSASYFTESGFLDEAGIWEAFGIAHLPGAPALGRGTFYSKPKRFEVCPLFKAFSFLDGSVTDAILEIPAPLEVSLGLPTPTIIGP